MCGICGKVTFDGSAVAPDLIRGMCATLQHRGPNDEGVYARTGVGLGQRRLSIIDLTASACPPLSNEDHTVWMVFNGEIYNFRELRKTLQQRGHAFATRSDTEVILHLYEDEGVQCLQRLCGMFAFALWDDRRHTLFCARDRLGKKPLCYARTPKSFVFGSEIKAITADRDVSVAPNYGAIDLYLTHQFVPSPYTAFEGIYRLRPGEYLTCDRKGQVETERYWVPPIPKETDAAPEEIQAELVRRLRAAVRRRMIADVPLGAFLSGGIDSSTVVALMAQESGQPVKTFSIGFEDQGYDELPYARLLSRRYGTEHHELTVRPDAAEVLPVLVHHYNEPFADSSALPTYYVSKMTREHVTVALSGDGGDESFAGYDNYAAIMAWKKWSVLPLSLRRPTARMSRAVLALFPYSNPAARWRRGFGMLGAADVRERRLQYGTLLKPEEKRLAYTPLFRELIGRPPVASDPLTDYPLTEGADELAWLMRHDQSFYLPDCLMVKTDIASMANSLEVRCPFLDHELVEYAASIPSSMKRDSTGGKRVLRSAVKDLLPTEIVNKRKSGFGIPIARWFRNDLAPLLQQTLLDHTFARRGLFRPPLIRKMIEEHSRGTRDWSNRLWAFLFLELWFREFID